MFRRESGILLHPTSLPGRFGVGDLGPEALRWIKWLDDAGQRLWQVLPLTPVGRGFSPYHCSSSFAGNTLLLSPERLLDQGLLEAQDLPAAELPEGRVDETALMHNKPALLRKAARMFLETLGGETGDAFGDFKVQQQTWLDDYCRYAALKEHFGGRPWWMWPSALRDRSAEQLGAMSRELANDVAEHQALQFLFEEQWQSVRRIANLRKIRLIGDLPIFVSLDSADVWAHQHLFQLNPDGSPRVVAGVPPDYFAKEGQRWGNPLYAWPAHATEDFRWWAQRIERTLSQCDILRIDHFRGFAACWEIPADEPTAIGGQWVPAPGKELFESVRRQLGHLPVIAEDLGIITDDVVELREHFGFPTMRVMQFGFGADERLRPNRFPKNCVAYTGTHDNDTTVGWYSSPATEDGMASAAELEAERDRFRRYFSTDGSDVHWTAIHRLMQGRADAVIFPLQDVMGLGSEARMNTPGTVGPHNWTWRCSSSQFNDDMLDTLRIITQQTGRNPE